MGDRAGLLACSGSGTSRASQLRPGGAGARHTVIVPPAKSTSSTPPADLRLSLEERGQLRAVVFDANAFGFGRPDLAFLEDLARRLQTIGIETWVPEPVAWEWAQHLAEDWEKIQTATASERRQLRRARLAGHESPYGDKRAVIDAFLQELETVAHLSVIALPPESALLALRDQILLIPPGRRKGDVKTGASDSAWLRAVLDVVDGDTARLLLVSQDKDVKAAFAEWKKPCPLMRQRSELKATMSEFTVDQGRAENLISQYLTAVLNDSLATGESLDFGIDAATSLERAVASSLEDHEPDTGLYGASLTRLTGLAGILDTYVEAPAAEAEGQPRTSELGPPATYTALATVFFLADAQATVSRLYDGEDPRVDTHDYEGVLVRVPMSFDIRDGSVIAARGEDEASVFLDHDRYDEPDEAAAELLDALGAVPGLTPPEWPEASSEIGLVAGAHATPVSMEISEPLGEWQLDVNIGDDTAELRCVYDDSGLVSDHEDTFYVFPPYHAEFRGDQYASRNPFWALNQWIIVRT